MHLVVVHGYLLRGTGSNIYSANVAKTWKSLGHAVTVLCQDRKAEELEFVDECFIGTDNLPTTAPRPGTIRVVVPDIKNLLLVYVFNRYDGFRVKAMGDNQCCSLTEIDDHVEMTSAALRKVLAQGVDRVLANHVMLSPVIAHRACDGMVPYDVKIHGSAIGFSLKKRPELMKYAVEGLRHCEKIVIGTTYIGKVLDETFVREPGLHHKQVKIPPGIDPSLFQLLNGDVAEYQRKFLEKVESFIDRNPKGRQAAKVVPPKDPIHMENLHDSLTTLAGTYDQWAVDSDLIKCWPAIAEGEPIIVYFGAFLNTKGVGEVIASFPAILQEVPKARLLLIGYGGYREHMEGMISAMEAGDVDAFIAFCQAGDFLDASADQLRATFRKLAPEECQRITITGILEHSQLCEILCMASVAIVGSKYSETFGMVMVEAMSSGVLPVCNYHSGLADIVDVVKKVDPLLEAAMRMEPQPGGKFRFADGAIMMQELPKKITEALRFLYPNNQYLDSSCKRQVAQTLRKIAVDNYSWAKICEQLLQPLLHESEEKL